MSLVYHHIPPTELLESRLLLQNHLIRCNYHIPFPWEYLLTNDTGLCDKINTQSGAKIPSIEPRPLTLSSCVPISEMVTMDGHHLLNSIIQLARVLLGAMTIWGPGTSLRCIMYPSNAIVWRVLPKPYNIITINN